MDKAGKGVVIYGVLNWGLGHATRSVPVIQRLLEEGFRPVIASDGTALVYLQNVFPDLSSEELPAYNISYSKRLSSLAKVALQAGKIFKAQRAEKKSLETLVDKYRPVGIISDNRLGFYYDGTPSVYISHQLKLPLPFARNFMSRWHHRFIEKFNECWIPDFEGSQNLAGEMTHSLMPRVPVKYLGPLSRFENTKVEKVEPRYEACFILSGPEPQRSLLEEKIIDQVESLSGNYVLIRGKRGSGPIGKAPENLEVLEFASQDQIAYYIRHSKVTVSRSGYSSVMDYYYLKNRALLIPTPGQPEQEYLARYLLHKGFFLYSSQEFLDLRLQLKEAESHPGIQENLGEKVNWGELFAFFEGKRKS